MKKTPVNALDILQLLEGKWSISRNIDNKIETILSGYASGETIIEFNDQTTLSYNEIVKASFRNGIKSTGKIYYKFRIVQNQIHQYLVTSSEESHMFELIFFSYNEKKSAKTNYICGKDKYDVSYVFLNDNHFQITYTVTGSKKNYITQTNFERISIN